MAKGDNSKKGGKGGPAPIDKDDPSAILASLPRVNQHEALHTINHLLQTSAVIAVKSLTDGSDVGAHVLQRCRYVQSLALKATLRMDTSVKRSMCKRCGMVLLPGLTASVRVKGHRAAHMVSIIRCRMCDWQRRMPCQPIAPDPRFNKFLSQRRARRAERKLARQLEGKVASLRDRLDVPPFRNAVDSRRLGQRARRRRARAVYDAVQGLDVTNEDQNKALAMPGEEANTTKRKRSRPARRRKGLVKKTDAEGSGKQCKRARVTARARKQKPLNLPMMKFTDRIRPAGAAASDSKHESSLFGLGKEQALGTQQMEAIALLRGNHVVTQGLGKGGTALILEGEA